MKTLATFAVVTTIFAAGCQTETAPPAEVAATPVAFDFGDSPTVEMHVPDMMCQFGCAARVKEVLTAQEGVEDVQIDFGSRRVGLAIIKEKFDADAAVAALVDYDFGNTKLIVND
ncbi:MAG: heavy-metal-associated domain-containing protein [Bythopirellula sp.]